MLISVCPENPVARAATVSICALLLLPLLGACDSSDSGKTVGQKLDNVVARTEQVAADVKDAAKTSADSAGAAVLDGAERAQTAARQTADNVAMESQDLVISASVAAGLLKDPDLSMVKIDVDSKRGTVSLYGPAPSEEARLRATVIARGVKGVVDVDNKLTVKTS